MKGAFRFNEQSKLKQYCLYTPNSAGDDFNTFAPSFAAN